MAGVTTCELPDEWATSLSVPGGTGLETLGVVAYGTLKVGDRVLVVAPEDTTFPVFNLGPAPGISEFGVSSRVGSVMSVPDVFLRSNAVVEGDVATEGNITTQAGATVSGNQESSVVIPAPGEIQWINEFVQGPDTSVLLQNQATQSLEAGTYGDVHVHAGSTLTLSAGTYRMQSLKLEPQSTLVLSGAPVVIHVASEVIWRGQIQGGSPAEDFLLVYDGTDTFLALETPFKGTLLAANASVRLGVGGTPHSGAIFARQVEIDPDVTFTRVPFAHWGQLQHHQELTLVTPSEPVCDDDVCCPAGMQVALLDGEDNVTVNFQTDNFSCENDEAASAQFRYLSAGTTIQIDGNPNCDAGSEDWGLLTVHKGVYVGTLGHFDVDVTTDAFSFDWHDEETGSNPFDPRFRMLTGKVSCVRMIDPNLIQVQ